MCLLLPQLFHGRLKLLTRSCERVLTPPRPRLLRELWDLSNSKSSLCVLPKVLSAHILTIYNQVLQPHQPHHLLLRWGNLSTQFGSCSTWRCWSRGWKGSKATEAPRSTISGQSARSGLAHVDEVGVLAQHANPKDEWQRLLWSDQGQQMMESVNTLMTVTTLPQDEEENGKLICAESVIVFSNQQHSYMCTCL